MNSMLIHGCYDHETLKLLKDKGISDFSFDLRGRSTNLIPFGELKKCLTELSAETVYLTFQNDKKETILSYLDLLKNDLGNYSLILRDKESPEYYLNLQQDFFWMFEPEANWKEILHTPNLKGVFLPVKYQLEYGMLPELWEIIEQRNLETFLHAETFEETAFLKLGDEVKLSIDLTSEVEKSFRKVDHEKLNGLRIWRKWNEITSR